MNAISIATIFSVLALTIAKTGPSHDKVVICYISTWAVYRPDKGKFGLENVDPNLCTHAIYAFAGLDETADTIKALDPWQDLEDNYGRGGYHRLTGLRQTHPHLKVLLAIGGWNEGSLKYSQLSANSERRKRFVKNALTFIQMHKFDGLDLDWEYPTQRGGQHFDKDNFVLLVKDLRDSFRPHKLLLTSAFGASKKIIDEAYDIRALSKYLDFLHIMCYDYGGAWDRHVSANAPLRGQGLLNVEFTIDYLIKLGASPSKIVMGLPFYGRTFVTKLDGNLGDASNEVGFLGDYTREAGFMGYNEICAQLSNRTSGWQKSYDTDLNQAIAKHQNQQAGETRVAVYDSSRSIANKVRYAMGHNLAGVMIWSIDTDDFLGDCDISDDTFVDYKPAAGIKLNIPDRYNANYPLLRTINEAIILSLSEIAQEAELSNRDDENRVIPESNNHGKGDASILTSTNFYSAIISIVCTLIIVHVSNLN